MDFSGQVDWGRQVGLFYHLIGAGTAGLGYAGRAFQVKSGGGCEPWTRRSGFGAPGCHSRCTPLREERKVPMVWTTVLLVVVLVLGRGEAQGLIICDELAAEHLAAGNVPEDRLTLRGFFVDPARQTRLFVRVRLNEEELPYYECFLQHEAGPFSPVGGTHTHLLGVCRDPVSGRDHATLSTSFGGNSGIASLQYWSVQPATKQMTLEYSEYHGAEGAASSDAAGQCLWREDQKARETFDQAMAALQIGGNQGEETLNSADRKKLDIAVGETLALPTREIPAAVVRHWLRALVADPFVRVTFETARYSDESPTLSWRILQILGQHTCGAPGVVLLQDTRSGQWRSIYNVPSGCSKVNNFPLQNMIITGETLFANFCINCIFWGQYANFILDLPTNRVTRLEGERSRGENMPVTDPLAFVDQGGSDPPSVADAAR